MNTRSPAAQARLGFLEQTVFRGLVWMFIGIAFGFIFVVLAEYLRDIAAQPLHLVAAAAGAATLTALFYGSMRLAVLVANFTFIAMVVYTWGNDALTLEPLVLIGAGVGLVVGTIYGWLDPQSRVFCADAKIMAGLFAGVTASASVFLVSLFFDELPYPWAAMTAVSVAAGVYLTCARWFVKRCHGFLPPAGDGALVGLGVGTGTGLLFMIMAGTLDPHILTPFNQLLIERVQLVWGDVVAGTAGLCALFGVIRSVLRVPWYDL